MQEVVYFRSLVDSRLSASEAIHSGMPSEQVAQTPKMRYDAVDRTLYDAIKIYITNGPTVLT